MPWAIFHQRFEFDFRPHKGMCRIIRPSDVPQEFPERVIAAAVDANKATRVDSPRPEQKRAYKRSKRATSPTT